MKVLMISDVFFPRINGVSTSIESFRHSLAAHDMEVTVLAPHYPQGHVDDPLVTRVDSMRVPFDPEDRLMRSRALQQALHGLSVQGFDLVHVQTPFAAHFAGLRFARRHGLPCLATYHTHFEEYLFHYVPALPKSWLRAAARQLARVQCNGLDAVVVPSSAMRDTLTDYGVTAPIYQVPTGIPLDRFASGNGQAFRARHGIAADQPMALYVGRVAHEKNIDFLLDAMPHALRDCPALILVVAGEGPALPALKRRAEALGVAAQVRFVGYLDRLRELPDAYAAADVFVFASRTETQGLVLLEAMAAGVPVLAFAALGTREIVEPGRGAIPAPQEVSEFGQTLAALANDLARRQQMAEEALSFAAEWSTEACAQRMAGVYHEVCS